MYLFRPITLSLLMIPLIGCTPMVAGVSDSAAFIEPMVERRDTLTATGHAVFVVIPRDNSDQRHLLAMRAAKLDSYRGLTEHVYGQYLDATTTVADMAVPSDSFRVRVGGVVYGSSGSLTFTSIFGEAIMTKGQHNGVFENSCYIAMYPEPYPVTQTQT